MPVLSSIRRTSLWWLIAPLEALAFRSWIIAVFVSAFTGRRDLFSEGIRATKNNTSKVRVTEMINATQLECLTENHTTQVTQKRREGEEGEMYKPDIYRRV